MTQSQFRSWRLENPGPPQDLCQERRLPPSQLLEQAGPLLHCLHKSGKVTWKKMTSHGLKERFLVVGEIGEEGGYWFLPWGCRPTKTWPWQKGLGLQVLKRWLGCRSSLQSSVRQTLTLSAEGLLPGFPHSSAGKESASNVGDLGSILGLRRPPGEGKDYPLWYSGLDSSLDSIVLGVAMSGTRLSDFHFHFEA